MKTNLVFNVTGTWGIDVEISQIGLNEDRIRKGLKSGLYKINWNTMRITDENDKEVCRVLLSEPNLTIKSIKR